MTLWKRLGYYVEVHYVGVENVEIAKKRVAHRVSVGGHGIPERDIERRYILIFIFKVFFNTNLNKIIFECDRIAFYDNTTNFQRFAILEDKELVTIIKNIPKWFENVNL